MNEFFLFAALLGLSVAARAQTAAVPAGLTNIGVAAAVRGIVHATPPGQTVGRVIGSGQPVYLNDHVTTGPDGRLQLLLLDQTTFTIGPNSDMVLDEFVYDPHTGVGTVSAQILKGFFRFVTGKIAQARPSSMKVRTPVGTIGIRGTMVVGHVDGENAEIVLIGPGWDNNANERRGGITVFNGKGSTDINSSGYGVWIKDGGAPGRGFRVSQTELETILGELAPKYAEGRGGPPDASRTSGDQLASGGINYHAWSNLNTLNTNYNQTSTFASQVASNGGGCGAGGTDCWSDLQAILTGNAGYQGSGNITCSGGEGCTGVGSTFNFALNVYFNSRTIAGDGSSYILINGSDGYYDQTNSISAISYNGRSGAATYTMTAADASWNYGGNSAGTTLTFLKGASGAASTLQMNLNYTNGSVTVSGTGSASKGSLYNP